MNQNLVNTVPYLRTSRSFPEDLHVISLELNRSYVDIANAVNLRTIGIFSTDKSSVTGESWFLTTKRQQTFRQLYAFNGPGPVITIPHGLNLDIIAGITKIYGTFTDGTKWYPLPYVDVLATTNQVNVIVGPKNIIITAGAGAPPAIVSGWVIIEWLSQSSVKEG